MTADAKSERQLEDIARQLGSRAASRFDADATAEKVVARLRSERRRDKPVYKVTRVLMRVAAVAVVAIGIGVMSQSGNSGAETLSAPVELADLSADELTEVMDSLLLDDPVSELASGSFYDLNESELAELLELMEG